MVFTVIFYLAASRRIILLPDNTENTPAPTTSVPKFFSLIAKPAPLKNSFSQHLGVNLQDTDIDRSHRIQRSEGKYRSQKSLDNCPETKGAHSVHKKRPPPIIVKFTRHNVKTMIYSLKKKLAGKPFLITESLTRPRKKCIKRLQKLRKKKCIYSYWTNDGNIFYMIEEKGQKIKIESVLNPCIKKLA